MLSYLLSAVELNRPQMWTDEALSSLAVSCPLTSLIPSHRFLTSVISRGIDTVTKFIGYSWDGWLWGWDWDCFG